MPEYKPSHHPTVIPRLFVEDPGGLVAFLRDVLGATGNYTADAPAEVSIGESMVLFSGTQARGLVNGFSYVYVPDVDATYNLAIAAGATPIEEPLDTPYGDRRATVQDPHGNVWQIATHRFPLQA
jgi:uncharacterized glyoxalase superfamily protein PhnB